MENKCEIKIDNKTFKILDNLARKENIGTYELAEKLIKEGFEHYLIIREGGIIARIPINDIKKANPEKAAEFIIMLEKLELQLEKYNVDIDLPNVIRAYKEALKQNYECYKRAITKLEI